METLFILTVILVVSFIGHKAYLSFKEKPVENTNPGGGSSGGEPRNNEPKK